MTTYAVRGLGGDTEMLAPRLATPRPAHALTPSALAAVETHRRIATERRRAKLADLITTDLPGSEVADDDVDPGKPALSLQALADESGFTTQILVRGKAVTVEGHRRGDGDEPRWMGFRAQWVDGRTKGASWHEPYRYELIDDPRPPGVNKVAKTGIEGHRPPGVGTIRLAMLASPVGIPIGINDLTAKLKGMIDE